MHSAHNARRVGSLQSPGVTDARRIPPACEKSKRMLLGRMGDSAAALTAPTPRQQPTLVHGFETPLRAAASIAAAMSASARPLFAALAMSSSSSTRPVAFDALRGSFARWAAAQRYAQETNVLESERALRAAFAVAVRSAQFERGMRCVLDLRNRNGSVGELAKGDLWRAPAWIRLRRTLCQALRFAFASSGAEAAIERLYAQTERRGRAFAAAGDAAAVARSRGGAPLLELPTPPKQRRSARELSRALAASFTAQQLAAKSAASARAALEPLVARVRRASLGGDSATPLRSAVSTRSRPSLLRRAIDRTPRRAPEGRRAASSGDDDVLTPVLVTPEQPRARTWGEAGDEAGECDFLTPCTLNESGVSAAFEDDDVLTPCHQ